MSSVKLPVLFRADRTRDAHVTAVFPTCPHDEAGIFMVCYAHIGQHGSCSLPWHRTTRPATEAERAPLLAELRQIYERDGDIVLHEVRRITPAMHDERRAEARS